MSGHYLKPGRRVSGPCVVFSVVVEPVSMEAGDTAETDIQTFGSFAACCQHRRGNTWRPTRLSEGESAEQFWHFLRRNSSSSARNYVVSPRASDALTLLNFWSRSEYSGVAWAPGSARNAKAKAHDPNDGITRFRRLCTKGSPDIIDYTVGGRRFVWLSGIQYLPLPEEEIAVSLGYKWAETGDRDSDAGKVYRTAAERCGLWQRAYTSLVSWWQITAKAPWGLTTGQLAVGMLRTHIRPKSLSTHQNDEVHQLERRAAFGGRASTWFFGEIGDPREFTTPAHPPPPKPSYPSLPGPLVSVDVRSMYPSLLRDQLFPVRLISHYTRPGRTLPLELARDYGVIASVTIETTEPEFPFRHNGRIHYPVGRFQTVLTGPELLRLAPRGRVIHAHECAVYALGRPFQQAAGAMIDLREASRASGNRTWELFAKLLGNSLGGKLAQRSGRWLERRAKLPMQQWGEWYETGRNDGASHHFRAVAGLVWEYSREESHVGPYTAAFDYLTAYGRLVMRKLRACCPSQSIISQDTDGLWCTLPAVDAMVTSGYVFGDKAGNLRIDKTASAARFLSPRHYWTPGQWILSGFSDARVGMDGTSVIDSVTHNPIRVGAPSAPHWISRADRRSVLKCEPDGGRVDPFGWWLPAGLAHGG